MHPVEKNHFFELDESFPYNEYKSKLKENLFMDAKFSFDFERILSQITELKASLLKNNSPAKTGNNNNNNSMSNNIPIILNSNKKEKEDNINRTQKKLSKNDENQKKTRMKIKDANKQINSPSEIRKYLTPPKERPAPNHIFIDDTFVGHKEENELEIENCVNNGKKVNMGHKINTKSQSAKNSDHKVILFMAGNEKWTRLNEQSNKKASKKINEDNKTNVVNNINSNSAKKKKVNNNKLKDKLEKNDEKNAEKHKKKNNENYNEKINNKSNEKINEKNIIYSDIFQEKFSEIQCIGDQSECLTPLKLLKELAQFKNLALEKSLTSEFNKSKDSENILKKSEDDKNLIKVSKKLKDKFKQDYNLDIDLIEKESKNSAMQTPSFGANNGLQGGKHSRNGAEKNPPSKKMEQINEVCSPKEEKFGHYEYIEKIYQPVLKKNPKK